METLITSWSFVAVAFAAGCIVGGLLYWATSRSSRDVQKLKANLDAAEEEFEEYKTSVSEHFNKTSELVSVLTQDYVKVHKHLADGAQLLGETNVQADLLEQQPAKALISATDTEKSDTSARTSHVDSDTVSSQTKSPSAAENLPEQKPSQSPEASAAKSPDPTALKSDSSAGAENARNKDAPEGNQPSGSNVAGNTKASAVNAASREYISETLKEAADIADKIDRDIEHKKNPAPENSTPENPTAENSTPEITGNDEDISVPTLSNIVAEPLPVFGPPVPETARHSGSKPPNSEKRESM